MAYAEKHQKVLRSPLRIRKAAWQGCWGNIQNQITFMHTSNKVVSVNYSNKKHQRLKHNLMKDLQNLFWQKHKTVLEILIIQIKYRHASGYWISEPFPFSPSGSTDLILDQSFSQNSVSCFWNAYENNGPRLSRAPLGKIKAVHLHYRLLRLTLRVLVVRGWAHWDRTENPEIDLAPVEMRVFHSAHVGTDKCSSPGKGKA